MAIIYYRDNKWLAMYYDEFKHCWHLQHDSRWLECFHGPAVLKYIIIHRPEVCYHYSKIILTHIDQFIYHQFIILNKSIHKIRFVSNPTGLKHSTYLNKWSKNCTQDVHLSSSSIYTVHLYAEFQHGNGALWFVNIYLAC